jgi:hypothetical protein
LGDQAWFLSVDWPDSDDLSVSRPDEKNKCQPLQPSSKLVLISRFDTLGLGRFCGMGSGLEEIEIPMLCVRLSGDYGNAVAPCRAVLGLPNERRNSENVRSPALVDI